MSTLRVNSGTIIASPTWEPTGLLQDQVLTLSGLFYSPVAFGTPYRFSLPAGRNGPSLRSPMMILSIRFEHARNVAVQRSHDADAREHRRPARRRHQDQGLHCGLPFRSLVFSLRKSRDVFAGVRERDKLATARQRYRFIKASFPAPDQPPASIGTRRRFMVISIF